MYTVQNFKDLTCWKKARELKKKLYLLAKELPGYEQYKLASQIRSAAVSVTANISEGFGRFYYPEKIQFARYARSSVLELEDHLITCLDVGYIKEDSANPLINECIEVSKSISGYIGFIKNQKKN